MLRKLRETILCDNKSELKRLLENGQRSGGLDLDKPRLLHLAIQANKPTLVQMLCDAGAHVELRNAAGQTPLELLFSGDCSEVDPKDYRRYDRYIFKLLIGFTLCSAGARLNDLPPFSRLWPCFRIQLEERLRETRLGQVWPLAGGHRQFLKMVAEYAV